MSGRKGASLLAGEDTELCFALRASGWRFWYDDALILRHFITKERLQWEYALRLMRGMGRAAPFFHLYLMELKAPPFDRYPNWKKTWVFQWAKTFHALLKLFLSHPGQCLSRRSDSAAALKFEKILGEIATLFSLFGRYGKIGDQIRNAAWAQRKRGRS